MRTLEAIEADLKAARNDLGKAEGTPTEVYSRIVGYYRSVRNWNRGKREEYGERKLFVVESGERVLDFDRGTGAERVLLFVRAACPACPAAKEAASRLGMPVEQIDADTEAGLEAAERYQVYSTPTAILLDAAGREKGRARDARAIAALGAADSRGAGEFAPAASQ